MNEYLKAQRERARQEFLNYLEETIPYYSELSQEELTNLEYAYFEQKRYNETYDNVWNSAWRSYQRGSDIDWQNDIDKAQANAIRASHRLRNIVQALHGAHGYVPPQEETEIKQGPKR